MRLVAAYLRVSTVKQETEAQRKAIQEFAEKHGFQIIWFEEPEGTSGGVPALERPRFRAMMEFLESNPQIRDIIVFELPRLGRDYDDLKNILHEFEKRGYRLWIVTLPTWNELVGMIKTTDNPLLRLLYKLLSDLIISVMAFASAQERVMVSLRTKAGLEKARAQGKRIGRPPYPFPEEEVRALLAKGYKIMHVWKMLKADGKICRNGRCMSYETFRLKVKQLGLTK